MLPSLALKFPFRAKSIFVVLLLVLCFRDSLVLAQTSAPIQLSWLGNKAPSMKTGVSWGVPFKQGEAKKESNYILTDSSKKKLDIQSWPMAYWPDGSIKWVGLSTVVENDSDAIFYLSPTLDSSKGKNRLKVVETSDHIRINTGLMNCEIPLKGDKIISSLHIGERLVSTGGELVCILQDGPSNEYGKQPDRKKLIGKIRSATVEKDGPVRSVIKIEGVHGTTENNTTFLPFIIRLYFYAGQQAIKIVHTNIYDGDQQKDFIRGLGIVFEIPMQEEVQNRHIRFSGEDGGFWSEPVQPLVGRRTLSDKEIYPRQLRGERVPNKNSFSEREQHYLENWAAWNDFKLIQDNADGFRIRKRTNGASAWLEAGAGGRSSGLVFAGDVSGGLSVCVRDFWQSFPGALEVRNARTEKANLTAWLWSPDGPEMDMRHYDTIAWGHDLEASYEDVQPGFSTPTGVARTSELLLYASSDVPTFETLNGLADLANDPPLLVASPNYIHDTPVFGVWSLPDTSTSGKKWIEHQLDNAFEYYQTEVEDRNWYGYWDYGDVMHAYDVERHKWRYDIGGYAWDNSELVPNMWLWYSFLRSGRKDIFRMAEAMTRHASEVDVYHLGRFEGLGSRHNVRHWGDGAKEVRISQAALNRYYYYLTTDERTGDLMEASVEASNRAIGALDPLRLILEKSAYPTHARMGPDWLALVGNWMTAWERTGDEEYKNRILTGVNSFYEMPFGLYSGKGAAMGYDPSTYRLYQLDETDVGYSHLSVLMGGPEVAFELTPLIANEKWEALWLQFCKLYGQSPDFIEKELGVKTKLGDPELWYARLPAYYARKTGEEEWAKKAWNDFLDKSGWEEVYTNFEMNRVDAPNILSPVHEVEGVSTNNTAQWSLNAIELLELIGDKMPINHPLYSQLRNESKN